MLRPAALAVLVLSLMACSGRAPVEPQANPGTNPGPKTEGPSTPTPQSFTFTPTKGSGFSVVLPGHGTTGYTWNLVPGFDARVVAQKGASRVGTLPANAPLGQSADEIFDFTATGSGSTKLVFSLYRSWESPDKASESRTYTVNVP